MRNPGVILTATAPVIHTSFHSLSPAALIKLMTLRCLPYYSFCYYLNPLVDHQNFKFDFLFPVPSFYLYIVFCHNDFSKTWI